MLTETLKRDQERWGMSEPQAALRFGVAVRAYREIEAKEQMLDLATYDAIWELFGWPQAFVAPGGRVS